ncbi:MAG: hypothetical protein LBC33_01820 [Mycoplasmataceae bacterium]|jgi:ABC-type transporter Mla subunit MlaD|nr:hypothetical protein [Mycoplasmataceae bacterium]
MADNNLTKFNITGNTDLQDEFSRLVQAETARSAVDDSNDFDSLVQKLNALYASSNQHKLNLITQLADADNLLVQINTTKRELNEVQFSIQQYIKLFQGQVDDAVNRQKELFQDLKDKEFFHQ